MMVRDDLVALDAGRIGAMGVSIGRARMRVAAAVCVVCLACHEAIGMPRGRTAGKRRSA